MKTCIKCGNQLNDDAKFCGSCGTPQPAISEAAVSAAAEIKEEAEKAENAAAETVQKVKTAASETVEKAETAASETAEKAETAASETVQQAETAAPAAAEAVKEKKPFPKKPVIIGGICVAAVAVIAIVVAIILGNRCETIDCKNLVKAIYVGPNGHADACIILADGETMQNYLWDEEISEKLVQCSENLSSSDVSSAIYEIVNADPDTYEDGSATWIEKNTSGYLADKAKTRSKSYTVLSDSSATKDAAKELRKIEISVKAEDLSDLSAGDKIHVTIKYDEDDLKDVKVKLTNTEFDITVGEDDLAKVIEIDPFEGFEVSCSGYETAPEIDYDYGTIDEESRNLFSYSCDYDSFDNAKMNGDKITFTATPWYEGEDGIFKYDGKYYSVADGKLTYTYELSGLTELKTLDAFDGIKIECGGISPKLSVDIDTSGCSEELQEFKDNIYYSFTYPDDKYNGNLAIGDTITVSVEVYATSELIQQGYCIDTTKTYEYTIPADANIPYYANSIDDYEGFDAAEYYEISKRTTESVDSYYVWDIGYAGGKITSTKGSVAKTILLTDKWGGNRYYTIYEVSYTAEDWSGNASNGTMAVIFYASDNYVDEEGTFVPGDYLYTTYRDTVDEFVTEIQEGYTEDDGYTVTVQ